MCNKPISLCCIFVVNLVALILCVVAFSFTIWAHSTNKLDILQGVPGLELKAKDVDTIYYVAYGIFGGLAVVCIIGIVACCCCQKCCMTVYAILVIIIKIGEFLLHFWVQLLPNYRRPGRGSQTDVTSNHTVFDGICV